MSLSLNSENMADEPDEPSISVFLLMADIARFLAMISLPIKIILTRNCAGISGKTQLLYVLIFTTRYVNITFTNLTLEMIHGLVFTLTAYLTVLLIYFFQKKTYEHKNDFFRIDLLILPSIALALPYPYSEVRQLSYYQSLEIFSNILEAVAIVPQTFFSTKQKKIHSVVAYYIGFILLSSILYIVYYLSPSSHHESIFLVSNVVQFIFCCDYFMKNMLCFRSSRSFEFNDQETGDAIAMNVNH